LRPRVTVFPYTTLFRSDVDAGSARWPQRGEQIARARSDLQDVGAVGHDEANEPLEVAIVRGVLRPPPIALVGEPVVLRDAAFTRSEEHTSELQSRSDLV